MVIMGEKNIMDLNSKSKAMLKDSGFNLIKFSGL
jgi:hypothetical protein